MKLFLPRVCWLIILLGLTNSILNAQEKTGCGTMYADSMLRANNTTLGTLEDFENWLQTKIAEAKENTGSAKMQTVYTLPVIVHVIHSGEALGVGRNISDAQVNSQITVLNNDFRKTNSDISNVPSAWTSTAADCEINFCMATKGLTGNTLATPGIDRINAISWGYSNPPYTISYFENNIKPSTIWDVNKYLNIWVADIYDASVGGVLLGWSTFPPSSGVTGLTSNNGNIYNDGVVISYKAFGTQGTVLSPNNKGRTTTHEVGHWLGLRHIWGDDSGACTGSDYCNDTPNQADATGGCPTFPKTDACSGTSPGTMFMNYMNYVNDACMYMFTNDQKTRIQTVMSNSTMRKSVAQQSNCLGSGIDDDFIEAISIYPNPAKNKLYINISSENTQDNMNVTVFGMLGNVVQKSTLKNSPENSVDISTLSDGVYFIEIKCEAKTYLKKFIVAK